MQLIEADFVDVESIINIFFSFKFLTNEQFDN